MSYKEVAFELKNTEEKFSVLCAKSRELDGGFTISPEMRAQIDALEERIEWLKGEKEFHRVKELQEEDDSIASVST